MSVRTLGIVGIAVLAVYWAWRAWLWFASRPRFKPSRGMVNFRDMLRHPWKWWEMEADEESLKRQVAAETLTDEQLAAAVHDLLDPETAPLARARLEHHGARSVPFLIRSLPDRRFRESRYGNSIFDTSPFESVLDILKRHHPAEAIPPLVPLVRDADESVRRHAAGFLASIGAQECIEPVSLALADPVNLVRTFAMNGLLRGLDAGRARPEFRAAMFDRILPLLEGPDDEVLEQAPLCLLRLDQTRALPVLLDLKRINPASPRFNSSLEAINKIGASLPAEVSLPLLDQLRPLAGGYPGDRAYGGLLIALARGQHPRAEELIRNALDWGNEQVRTDSAEALCALRGIPHHHDNAFAQWERAGCEVDGLSGPVRTYLLVRFFIDEIDNGGWSQYFFNSSGDHATETVAALEEIGAPREADRLRRAMALFGPGGPSPQRRKRMSQLAKISPDAGPDPFDGLYRDYDEKADNLNVILFVYAADHPEHFRNGAG